jgi:hypothetical protein
MSNRYLVNCPNFDCDWSGHALARKEADRWAGLNPSSAIVAFHCPRCEQSWHARVTGVVIEPLLDEAEIESIWPPVEIGVGD